MSNSQLDQAVQQASGAVEQQEKLFNQHQGRNVATGKYKLWLLLLSLVVYAWVSYSVFVDNAYETQQDFQEGAIAFMLRADESVVNFYKATGDLPQHIPDALVSSFLYYEPIGTTTYSIQGRYPPFDKIITRDVTQPLNKAQLITLLQGP